MIIYTVPCGSSSGSLPRACSQLFFDKIYRDKMAFDLWGMCVLCAEESVRKTSRRAIGGELGIQQSVTLKRSKVCSSNLQGTDLS